MGTAAVHDHVPAAARRRWPKWAEAKKGTRQVLADCWQVVRVPSFLVLLVEHITDLTSGAGGFAVQYNQVSQRARELVIESKCVQCMYIRLSEKACCTEHLASILQSEG